MPSKSKRTTLTKSMLREAARAAHRRTRDVVLPYTMRVPSPGKRRDQATFDDQVAWARASASARRRGLH